MIHSLAGGVVKEAEFFDFVKVKTDDGCSFWFINDIFDLKIGDLVLAPIGKNNVLTKAVVERIDKNVNGQTSPLPLKRMKRISQRE